MTQTLPRLFKHIANGQPGFWRISVDVTSEGPLLLIQYGRVGGKVMETRRKVKGKNKGKSNETTDLEQAHLEAASMHKEQLDRNLYGYTVEESFEKKLRAPMLAENYEDFSDRIDWDRPVFVQPKLDGHRCIARMDDDGDITLVSRGGEEIETLGHIKQHLFRILKPGQALDGELYLHGINLQKVSSLVRRYQPGRTEKIVYHVYDTMVEGPYEERYKLLAKETGPGTRGGVITVVPTFQVQNEKMVLEFQRKCIEKGYEGAMLRHGSFDYEAGSRSKGLLKVKTFKDAEFEIVGVSTGVGKFEGMAVFHCQTPEGNLFTVTAPGTHEEKKQAWKNKDRYIGKMLTVKYFNFTETEKPVPYLPVAKSIRTDI